MAHSAVRRVSSLRGSTAGSFELSSSKLTGRSADSLANNSISSAANMACNARDGVSMLMACRGVWCGVVRCGVCVVWCGVVWCGVVWCGVVWCGVFVAWCGVICVVWRGVMRSGSVQCVQQNASNLACPHMQAALRAHTHTHTHTHTHHVCAHTSTHLAAHERKRDVADLLRILDLHTSRWKMKTRE
jgi:hypothetical protein